MNRFCQIWQQQEEVDPMKRVKIVKGSYYIQ